MIENTDKTNIEYLYDTYSPMLYTIALQILPTKKDAEDMLIFLFKKLAPQSVIQHNHLLQSLSLIKLLLQTSKQAPFVGKLKINFKVRQFQKTPIFNQLLFEGISLDNYCLQNCTTRRIIAKKIRVELLKIRNCKINIGGELKSNSNTSKILK